ncbi:hypothetical protein ACEZDJ_38165 [Streptacidiphilus sp. N1-5]|uniref:XRE family transcriptional regulator n=1 Tax=Streptacidiphilus cavernicola TaxID=3342716 RepID=A0ABV6V083_9ACTN
MKDLADACALRGVPHLTNSVLANIESGRPDRDGRRRRDVSVDELLALALVLDVAPAHLLGLPQGSGASIKIAPGCQVASNQVLQQWVRGDEPLPTTDDRLYYASALEQLPARDADQIAAQHARSVIQDRAKEMLAGFHAEAEKLVASTEARIEAMVSNAEAAVASGATPQEVIDMLRQADSDG